MLSSPDLLPVKTESQHTILKYQDMGASDETLLNLIRFYSPDTIRRWSDSPLPKGAEGEEALLRRCSAWDPENFIRFFEKIIVTPDLPNAWAAAVFEGISAHLILRSGTPPPAEDAFQTPLPDSRFLARWLFTGLKEYPFLWAEGRPAAEALKAFSYVMEEPEEIAELVSYQLRLASHRDPEPPSSLHQQDGIARSSVRGRTAESVILLCLSHLKKGEGPPALLSPLLLRFATDPHHGVRVSLLKHLPELSEYDQEKAWQICHAAFHPFSHRLWPFGEPFLQARFYTDFRRVRSHLEKARKKGCPISGDSWGRVLAAGYLSGHGSADALEAGLLLLADEDAWLAAFEILKAHMAEPAHQHSAVRGMIRLIGVTDFTPAKVTAIESLFTRCVRDSIDIALQIAYKFIHTFKGLPEDYDLSRFYHQLSRLADKTPLAVNQVCETLLTGMERSSRLYQVWQGHKLSDLLRRIPKQQAPDFMSRLMRLQNRAKN